MSKKSQFEYRFRTCSSGFLLIECLIALMLATTLVMIIHMAFSKICTGQTAVIMEFRAIQQASNLLHKFLSSSGTLDKNLIDGFKATVSPCSVEIISCDHPVSWLTKKQLPLQSIKLTVDWAVGQKKQNFTVYTCAITQGET